jgi:hypothetical protein
MEAESFPEVLSVPMSQAATTVPSYTASGKPLCYPGCAWHASRTCLPVSCVCNDTLAFDRTVRIPDVLLEPPPSFAAQTKKPAPPRGLDGQTAMTTLSDFLEHKSQTIIHQMQDAVNKRTTNTVRRCVDQQEQESAWSSPPKTGRYHCPVVNYWLSRIHTACYLVCIMLQCRQGGGKSPCILTS